MKALVICFPLLLLLLLSPATALAAEGDTGTDGYFSWKELSDGTVEVTGYTGPANVIIPGELSGHTVSGIGQMAFYNMSSITSVTIPDSVRTIGNGAFTYCYDLSSVTFGNGLEQIGEYVFYETGLVSAVLPDSLVCIGESAFYQCRNLSAVTFGSKLKTIGAGAFGDCDVLISATFPDSLETIGGYAFYDCAGLSTIVFGSGLVSIGDGAFMRCPAGSMAFPDSLQTIGTAAFFECTGLDSVAFGNGLVSIGDEAFSYAGITSAVLPDSLETIGGAAFGRCASLQSVTFGSSLKSISAAAFVNTPIRSAVLPDSLISIGDSAFSNCPELGVVSFGNGLETIGQWAFMDCSSLTSVTLPASLTSLGNWTFYHCGSLVKVEILSRTASLHVGAFVGCPMTEGFWGFKGSTAENIFGAWYPFHYFFTVSFDVAGGTAVEDVIVEDGDTLPAPNDPTRAGHLFTGWYADSAFADPWNFSTDTITGDTTLYGGWKPVLALTASPASGSIYVGGRATITPNIAGGTWAFDGTMLNRDGNEFTGLKPGTTRVTYTAPDEQTAFIDVTITEAELPATGQDFSPALWLLAAAAGAGGASLFSMTIKRLQRAQ